MNEMNDKLHIAYSYFLNNFLSSTKNEKNYITHKVNRNKQTKSYSFIYVVIYI